MIERNWSWVLRTRFIIVKAIQWNTPKGFINTNHIEIRVYNSKMISLSTEDVSWIQLKYFVEHFLWIFGRFLLHRHFDIYVSIRKTNDKQIGQMNWNKRSAKQIKIHNVLKVFFQLLAWYIYLFLSLEVMKNCKTLIIYFSYFYNVCIKHKSIKTCV